jgi:hypothetical protein
MPPSGSLCDSSILAAGHFPITPLFVQRDSWTAGKHHLVFAASTESLENAAQRSRIALLVPLPFHADGW